MMEEFNKQCTLRNNLLSSRRYPPADHRTRYIPCGASPWVSLKYLGEVNTLQSTDTSDNGWIIDGVMLGNSMISVINCLTYTVKIINVYCNKVTSCIKLATRPWAITRVKREQIVVLCDNKLVFINFRNILSIVKEVHISGDCCGVVYTNNTLIVSFLNPGSIKILDLDGQILKVIATDNKGQCLFEEPSYIALSPDHQTLCVADEGNHSVTCMDLNGTIERVYKHDQLFSIRNLAVDRAGNIYIAGRGPYTIYILSPFCTTIRILDEGMLGINRPYGFIYCKRDNTLYISHFQGLWTPALKAVNTISIYQIIS